MKQNKSIFYLVLFVILFAFAWYLSKDIVGSFAFIDGPPSIQIKAINEGKIEKIVLSGARNEKEIAWSFTNVDERQRSFQLAGMTYTVNTASSKAIDKAYLLDGPDGRVLQQTRMILSPGNKKYILPFILENPINIPYGETRVFGMKVDAGRIDGDLLVNDTSYDIEIDSSDDVYVLSTAQDPVNIKIDKGDAPISGYILESRPYITLNSNSPSGELLNGENTTVAIFDIRADSGGDITFEPTDSGRDGWEKEYMSINFGFKLQGIDPGFPYESSNLTLRNLQTGEVLARETMYFTSNEYNWWGNGGGAGAAGYNFNIGRPIGEATSLVIPAGTTQTVALEMDTTLFTTPGDALQWKMEDYVGVNGNPDYFIYWGINGDKGDYGHSPVIYFGDIEAHKLTK